MNDQVIQAPANHQVFLVTGYFNGDANDVGLLKAIGASPISLTDLIKAQLPDYSVSMMLSINDLQTVVDQLEQRVLQLQADESRMYNVAGLTPGDLVPYRSVPVLANSPEEALAGAAASMATFQPLGAMNLPTYRGLLDDLLRCKVTSEADVKENGF